MNAFNIHDIATFLAIVDCGSLTQAAERIGLSKSIVSKRLKRLEEMLGVALLHRSTRGVTATAHGQASACVACRKVRPTSISTRI